MPYKIMFESTKKTGILDKTVLQQLKKIVPNGVSHDESDLIVYARDYWPISLRWHLDGIIPALPDCIVWPESTDQVAALVKLAALNKIPVIPYGGGSGVMGGTIPVRGGIIVDMKKMNQVIDIDVNGLMMSVQAGINGMCLERTLNRNGFTLGHIPQSLYCSSLGGWLACRAAGQFSTKYGKIEDMVVALEAVLGDGTIIRSKPVPRTSTGPSIEKLLLGSEGILGIITQATLKIWPYPENRALRSYVFDNIENALEAVRLIVQKNIFPAVVRVYDKNETLRHFFNYQIFDGCCMLVLVMEGIPELVELETTISENICLQNNGRPCGEEPVCHWLETRFNVKEASEFVPRGFIFDTIEISCGWTGAIDVYNAIINAMKKVEGVIVASGHASHFYPQGICFYFTFGGIPQKNVKPFTFYEAVWDATMEACIKMRASISHHHGIGITRKKWLVEELQDGYKTLGKIKRILDPSRIMNPGKLIDDDEVD